MKNSSQVWLPDVIIIVDWDAMIRAKLNQGQTSVLSLG